MRALQIPVAPKRFRREKKKSKTGVTEHDVPCETEIRFRKKTRGSTHISSILKAEESAARWDMSTCSFAKQESRMLELEG